MVHCVSGELGKVLGSLLFGVGLFTVCTFSLMLYTGKIGLGIEWETSIIQLPSSSLTIFNSFGPIIGILLLSSFINKIL